MEAGDSGPTAKQIEHLVGRTLVDPEFRQRLFNNPAAAAAELGITLQQDQIEHLEELGQNHMTTLDYLARGISSFIEVGEIERW